MIPTLDEYPPILLRSELADLLRISESTLSRWARDNVGPKCIILPGGIPRYEKGSVITYLKGL